MKTSLDTALLPDAFATCACCVRESLDAAGVLLDCASAPDETENDAWHMP
ncbi:hypothetical protein FB548_3724 [Pseudoxanthomonas sp. 3HH-4]|nr:hypothetical protein [Pseudoxanthomonas sp. 3HH-4]TQM03758.1 hypothetical protein FB548_3724 [Pseudoxanthomonas sp. 3HH-4]